MELLQLEPKKLRKLNKEGVETSFDLCHLFPYKFYDFTKPQTEITEDMTERFNLFYGTIQKVEVTREKPSKTKMRVLVGDKTLYTTYIGNYYMGEQLKKYIGSNIFVGGKLTLFEGKYYCMLNPILTTFNKAKTGVIGVYPKYTGISEEFLKDLIDETFSKENIVETFPMDILERSKMPQKRVALKYMHSPANKNELFTGIRRQIFEDLLYFACSLERDNRRKKDESEYVIRTTNSIKKVVESLPYDLTDDQKKVVKDIIANASKGKRVDALIQGDVGCGKSIVAFLVMLAMAENGYQSALMAPTLILAEQHYKELSSYASLVGKRVAYLGGNLKARERKQILEDIKEGKYDLVVGTHSLISDNVEFKNLALVCIDEEHRFGVRQRQAFTEKAEKGVHTIKFSATPIPRTLAESIFNDHDIYEIKTMPSNRKGVETCIRSTDEEALEIVKRELAEGSQGYIVCPLIDTDDEENKLSTVNKTAEFYKKACGVEVGIVTGKVAKDKLVETLERFKSGEIKILVATTVIEVGVNVPNATFMVIEDAYDFGLASLHQIRGRVGRGNKKGYCVLRSDRDSERLTVLTQTTDGFKIAEEDLRIRGAGNLLGDEQSGNNRFLQEALVYPKMFEKAKEYAKEMVDNNTDDLLISEMEKRNEKVYFKLKKFKYFE